MFISVCDPEATGINSQQRHESFQFLQLEILKIPLLMAKQVEE